MSETITRTRVMDCMDEAGHSSFGWDAADDEWVLPMIRRKMADGYVFWIVERNPLREVQLTRADDATQTRHVIIRDNNARELFEQGRIGIVATTDTEQARVTRRARNPEDAVANDTVTHRPLRGG